MIHLLHLKAAIPLAHLILTGKSTKKDTEDAEEPTKKQTEELTEVLSWSLDMLYTWFPKLQITRLMTDRCSAHVKAFAKTEGKQESGFVYGHCQLLVTFCPLSKATDRCH